MRSFPPSLLLVVVASLFSSSYRAFAEDTGGASSSGVREFRCDDPSTAHYEMVHDREFEDYASDTASTTVDGGRTWDAASGTDEWFVAGDGGGGRNETCRGASDVRYLFDNPPRFAWIGRSQRYAIGDHVGGGNYLLEMCVDEANEGRNVFFYRFGQDVQMFAQLFVVGGATTTNNNNNNKDVDVGLLGDTLIHANPRLLYGLLMAGDSKLCSLVERAAEDATSAGAEGRRRRRLGVATCVADAIVSRVLAEHYRDGLATIGFDDLDLESYQRRRDDGDEDLDECAGDFFDEDEDEDEVDENVDPNTTTVTTDDSSEEDGYSASTVAATPPPIAMVVVNALVLFCVSAGSFVHL